VATRARAHGASGIKIFTSGWETGDLSHQKKKKKRKKKKEKRKWRKRRKRKEKKKKKERSQNEADCYSLAYEYPREGESKREKRVPQARGEPLRCWKLRGLIHYSHRTLKSWKNSAGGYAFANGSTGSSVRVISPPEPAEVVIAAVQELFKSQQVQSEFSMKNASSSAYRESCSQASCFPQRTRAKAEIDPSRCG